MPSPPNADPLEPIVGLPGVAGAVAATRLAVDRLAGHRVLRRRSDDVRAESAVRGAAAAATVQLARPVGVDEVRTAAAAPGEADPLVRGAARVYAELSGLVVIWRQAPRQALARLHTLAARDLVDPDRLGRPVDAGATDRLAQLAELLAATRAPALVVAAVVHAELATVRPFDSADRVVAMAASRLVLVERGLDPGSLVCVEVGHLAERDASALAEYGSGGADRVASWVLHYAEVVQAGAQESSAIAEALLRG